MHYTVVASGSRGDVQPLVALAAGIKAAGHEVRFATQVDFEPFVRKCGLEYVQLGGSAEQFYSSRLAVALREQSGHAGEFSKFLSENLQTYVVNHLRECWNAVRGTDVFLCWPWLQVGPSIAEKLGIPYVVVSPNPVPHIPTWGFPNPFHAPVWKLGPLYNRLTWLLAEDVSRTGSDQINRWRKEELGLPPRHWRDELRTIRNTSHLFGYSPEVLPKPRDWADWMHVTGYWIFDEGRDYQPPEELKEFLAAGDPPVAIGFGSIVGRNPKQLTQEVVAALERAGQRGILIAGWGGLKDIKLPKTVLKVKTVPYDWLLPRVAAMVHHGGSGSSAAAMRAGIPSMAVPFGYDQPLWGQRIADLGVGVAPLPIKKLTTDRLAKAISRLARDGAMRERAQRLGEKLRAEDGVGRAVAALEKTVAEARKRAPGQRR